MGKILVTGGTGYIGSHTVVELIKNGYDPVIVDNLCNSKIEVLNRLETICGVRPKFYQISVQDKEAMRQVFEENEIDAIIHFAGLKSVGESVLYPEKYYSNNVGSSKVLLELMDEYRVHNIVFSSSATVYGVPERMPIVESDPIGNCSSPYGDTKYQIELLLMDYAKTHEDANVAILRYFNPIGAHPSGLIGEYPTGIPNNLMPYITQVAVGTLECLTVFGGDYDTRDGSCIRDYIHVCDLAEGHVYALHKLETKPGLVIYNLGTGRGTTVLELVHAFEEANNMKINYKVGARRDGDVPENYANCDKAYKEMGWKATRTIKDACRDSWNWQSKNPHGYDK
ncbi:MAG: UDP-glucose 4-epimerase GalE [Coprobacillus sp.]|nr:UDP-glucose 4-epimerase GalE [Coprobacillus sp.]